MVSVPAVKLFSHRTDRDGYFRAAVGVREVTSNPAGLLVLVGFLIGAVGSVPLALVTCLLARRVQPFARALRYAGVSVAFLVVVLAAAVATITPEAGIILATVAAVLGSVL
jgi:hypothetical protein